MKFPTYYNQFQKRPVFKTDKPSMTDQDKKQECDLNIIIQSYVRNGQSLPYTKAQYGDISTLSIKEYQDAMLLTAQCKSDFESLPSSEREKFNNNVSDYVAYISNPQNLKDCLDRNLVDIESVPGDVLDLLQNVEPVKAETPVTQEVQTANPEPQSQLAQ